VRWELEPNAFALRVYGEHPDNYVASAVIRTNGDRGWISSVNGERFYDAIAEHADEIMQRCGVSNLGGYMTEAHARLAIRRLGDRAEITARGLCADREMVWLVVTARQREAT
jgi:hypothetical protein